MTVDGFENVKEFDKEVEERNTGSSLSHLSLFLGKIMTSVIQSSGGSGEHVSFPM